MSEEYYKNLPKKRMAVGVLFFNEKEELLIVKPTYHDHWSIPGGVVDENESLREACIREVKEEINIDILKPRLLCIDYMSPEKSEYKGGMENLQIIFSGGILTEEQIKNITLPPDELSEHKFVSPSETALLFNKNLANRLSKCIEALKNNTAYYLEGGEL